MCPRALQSGLCCSAWEGPLLLQQGEVPVCPRDTVCLVSHHAFPSLPLKAGPCGFGLLPWALPLSSVHAGERLAGGLGRLLCPAAHSAPDGHGGAGLWGQRGPGALVCSAGELSQGPTGEAPRHRGSRPGQEMDWAGQWGDCQCPSTPSKPCVSLCICVPHSAGAVGPHRKASVSLPHVLVTWLRMGFLPAVKDP